MRISTDTHKNMILLGTGLLYVALCLVALVRDDIPFPFVQYQMFHRLLPDPTTKTYEIFIERLENDFQLQQLSFSRPFSKRETIEIFNYAPANVRDALAEHMLFMGRVTNPNAVAINLYELSCNCQNYYSQSKSTGLSEYLQNSCERILIKQASNF